MTSDTTVSVIVPSYNYGRFLRSCVVASAFAATDARVELRVHPFNRGHIATYNEGLSWANHTYTILLDSDDMLTAGSLRRSCDLLDARPEVGIVYGRTKEFYGNEQPGRASTTRSIWRIWQGREWFEGRCRMTENCVRQPSVVMRTSVLKKVGGSRPELPHAADMEMWLRLSLYSDVGYIGGTHQGFYRVHSAGMHRSQFGTVLADLTQVAAAFEGLLRDYHDMIPDHGNLERSVRETFARRALDAACRIYDSGRADPAQIAGLEELALRTYASARGLKEWNRLRWRKSMGPMGCLTLRPFLLFTIASRSWRKVKRYRLHKMGLL
jgi:hypothetical protein